MSNTTPTVKAAVTFAAQLRTKAEQERARDPYASPYNPSEASARKLVHRMAQKATLELPVTATPEDLEAAKASGPARAIAYMTLRARQHGGDYAEQQAISERSEQRHKRRQEQHHKVRDRERSRLTAGQRIDGVIARLQTVASVSASQLGRDAPASERDMTPMWCVDASQKAQSIALKAVRELERLEDELRVRDVGQVAA
jgi:hypothetical protein